MQRSHESNCASIFKTRSVQQKEEIKLQTQRQRNDVIKGTVLDFSRACFVQQKEEIKLTTQRHGQCNDVIKGTVLAFSKACFVQQKEEIKLTTQRQGQSILRSHSRHCASHLKSMFCPAEKKRSAYKHNVGDKATISSKAPAYSKHILSSTCNISA